MGVPSQILKSKPAPLFAQRGSGMRLPILVDGERARSMLSRERLTRLM
jgi:hypothetical protein